MLKLIFISFFLTHLSLLNLYWVYFVLVMSFMIFYLSLMNILNSIFFLNYFFFEDKISIVLVYLTIWIFLLSILCSIKIFIYLNKNFILNLMILMTFLIMNFLISNIFFFFFFFECSLIPTFYLILGWGMKIERVQSGFFMLFYTLFGSLPLMLMICYLMTLFMNSSFFFIEVNYVNIFIMLSIYLGFLMKIPMFMFHSWLPKAHVEAPVSGSMILAGVLLKLGGYGIIRFNMLMKMNSFFYVLIFSISLLGGVVSGLICLRQTDLKSLIAYSSVSHMSMIICSLFSFFNWGIFGSFLMMISHGFCSSCLFSLVNFNYERIGSRMILLNKGFINLMPSMTLWWFLFCAFNMGFPPSLNLISEIFMLNSIFMYTKLGVMYLFLMPLISAMYNLFLYSFSQHGLFLNGLNKFISCYSLEYLVCLLHFLPLFFSFLKMEIYL